MGGWGGGSVLDFIRLNVIIFIYYGTPIKFYFPKHYGMFLRGSNITST